MGAGGEGGGGEGEGDEGGGGEGGGGEGGARAAAPSAAPRAAPSAADHHADPRPPRGSLHVARVGRVRKCHSCQFVTRGRRAQHSDTLLSAERP